MLLRGLSSISTPGGPMREMREQPAGWYRDQRRPNVHRYWDGEHWSDWVGEELAVWAHRVDQLEPQNRTCG